MKCVGGFMYMTIDNDYGQQQLPAESYVALKIAAFLRAYLFRKSRDKVVIVYLR